MKTMRFLTAALVLILSTACVPLPSLNPLWDEAHLAPIAELEGSWVSEDGKDQLKFAVADKAKYNVTFTSKEGVSHFEAHSVKINDRLYLDFFPDREALGKRLEGEAYLPLIPTHFFARVKCSGNLLQLAALDDEIMEKKVKEGKANIPLIKWSDGVLLAADTPSIQQLLIHIGDDPEFWGETESFKRTPGKQH